jgi:riboflavin kinase/FMN adenylyltransferase
MMNLGGRPTFGDAALVLEAHLFDMQDDLYGQWVRVDVLGWLRATRRFDGPDALMAQLAIDEAAARAIAAGAARPEVGTAR